MDAVTEYIIKRDFDIICAHESKRDKSIRYINYSSMPREFWDALRRLTVNGYAAYETADGKLELVKEL